jgi:hypothetical protein
MRSLFRTRLVAAFAGTLAALTLSAQAAPGPDLRHIQVTYFGGPLLSHARVSTLFWGAGWKQSSLPGYFNNFFRELFADGRYLANLAQYGTPSMPIGNGTFVATASDPAALGDQVTDDQIQEEIRAQVAAHALPAPDANTVYVVFTPPHVVVVDATGADSVNDFAGYHDYFFGGQGGGFAYAVIPYDDQSRDARLLTIAASHELAEAVTDPQPTQSTLGWYDRRNGEIGDIPPLLYLAGRIGVTDLVDVLVGRDGTRYAVQKIWSVQDGKPVAFAAASSQ